MLLPLSLTETTLLVVLQNNIFVVDNLNKIVAPASVEFLLQVLDPNFFGDYHSPMF